MVAMDKSISSLRVAILKHSLTGVFFVNLQCELRVRYREEQKNVTRLTMENVSFSFHGIFPAPS